MRKHATRIAVAALLAAAGVGFAADAPEDGFKVIAVGGTKKIVKVKMDEGYKPITVGAVYEFGTVLKTASSSTADLELSPGNTFRLMARSKMTIRKDGKNPKLRLLKGAVSLKLDKMPKGHKLEIETPTAVCGALGTRFTVAFEDADTEEADKAKVGSRETRISCEKGAIYAASSFTVKGAADQRNTMDAPKIEAGTELVARIHEGLENSYTDVSVVKGSLTVGYGVEKGGEFTLKAEEKKPARLIMALEKSGKDVDVAVLEVKSGDVAYGKNTIEAADGPVLVTSAKAMSAGKAKEVGAYLAAAKTEAEMHSALVAAGKDPGANEELKKAAKKATDLRKSLLTKRVGKMLQQIRRGFRRPRIRR